jgi:hypothetical protein
MSKFNLRELGVVYTVLDKTADKASNMRVIDFVELQAAIGEFVGPDFLNVTPHVEQRLKALSGFVKSPYDVSWYAATREDFELSRAIMQARYEKNEIVIVEVLPSQELDTPFNLS